MSDEAAAAKAKGVEAFKAKDFEKAIEEFGKAIELTPSDHTLYGNTSASYFNINKFDDALRVAEKCIEINPSWSKGYQRKGMALAALNKTEEAKEAYAKGLEADPNNAQIKSALDELNKPKTPENPFFNAEAMGKLMLNEKTRKHLEDPDFRAKFELCKSNPQMMMQMMQMDPRFMDVFQVITGLDLSKMQEQKFAQEAKSEELRKKKEQDEKKKKEEEEERKKKEEEDSMTSEQKEDLNQHRLADEWKDKGNTAYKAKKFAEAIEHYDQAIGIYPSELTYYTNKAAVYFQMKEYQKCVELCDEAEEIAKQGYYDYVKLSKALGRKANALFKLEQYDESIACYKRALLEHNDQNFKNALRNVEKAKKKAEELAYIDPAKSEEHRESGNKLFGEGDFPGAIKEYDEGLKRDPQNVKIYSNRAFAYIKLMEFPTALKDIAKGLEIDPEFVKLWVRKGNIHFMMKEYHKALEAYDKGLKIDPENAELKTGKQKVLAAVSSGVSGGEDDEERMRHAMADPEIQALIKDYRVQQLLKEMNENPMAAQSKLQDPFLADAVNKLVVAGVLKMKY